MEAKETIRTAIQEVAGEFAIWGTALEHVLNFFPDFEGKMIFRRA